MDISTPVKNLLDDAVSLRRDLHRIPEISECETQTSAYIRAELERIGLRVKSVGTGLYTTVKGTASDRRTIGFRADIDALPIVEKSGEPFASTNGCMHACGHDGHTTALLLLARLLTEHPPQHNIRLIFQFGEEGAGGAERMIEGGALDGVDEIYAYHVCPELEVGKFASAPGALFAGTVEFDVTFTGRASHCATREQGIDALHAAARLVRDLPEIVEPFRNNALLHVGKLTAGSARNIVADKAVAECSFRFFDEADRENGMMRLERKLVEITNATGADHTVVVHSVYRPLINSAYALERFKRFADVEEIAPRYTAEDFSAYCDKVPGCMVWLGIRDEKHTSPLHSDTFGFDEGALLYGIEAFYRLATSA